MVETMCTSAHVKLKAGVNAKALTGAQYTTLINEAENFINNVTRTDYTASFSGLSTSRKLSLEDASSSHAAVSVIMNDMSGYTSRAEARLLLNVNWAKFIEIIKLIKEDHHKKFLNTT